MPVAFQPDAFQNNAFQTTEYPVGPAAPPVYALTVGGISQSIRAGTLRKLETINGRNTMSFGLMERVLASDDGRGSDLCRKHDQAIRRPD
jgi:hypothetical protein